MHISGWWRSVNVYGTFGLALLLSQAGCGQDARRPRGQAPRQPATASADTSAAGRLAALDTGLREIEQGLRTAERDRWDPAYVVERVGRDPATLTAWVRDSTAWIPYRGTLRGPVGVLMDRDGNSLDRALLLAKLLELAGHQVRLARAQLDERVADERLPELVDRRQALASPSAVPPALATTVSFASANTGPEQNGTARMIAAQEEAARALHAELDQRVRKQAARLLEMTKPRPAHRDWSRRWVAAVRALQDHWWVQRRDGDHWVDLDPLAAAVTALETPTVDAIPVSLSHRIAVRVIGETWTAGRLAERPVLADTIDPADLIGQDVVLQVWPARWPAELHSDPASPLGLRGVALEQVEWPVGLMVSGNAVAEGKLTDGEAEKEVRSPGPFGGIGGAMRKLGSNGSKDGARSGVLTSAWIEYELLAPDAPPRVIRRAIFDLLGPSARAKGAPSTLVLDERQRLTRSLALMIRTEILPVTGRMAPQYAAQLMMERLVANRALLRQLVGNPEADRPPDSAIAAGTPPLSALYSLAYARTAWSPVGGQQYVDRLGLLTQHRHPALMGNQFGMRGALDVAMGEMGVSLDVAEAFAVRLRQGVFDTNAEGLWWTGVASLNTGEVFGTSNGWTAVTPARRERLADFELPDDARWRIGQDLAAGLTVVAPEAAIPVHGEHYVGWWRIDPATGATRGMSGNGWGQCQAEYAVNLRTVVWAYIRGFFFEFALCQAIAQSINGSRTIAAELQKRKLWFWWMPPIKASDPLSVAGASTKTCLVSAMAAGFLATMPILLMAARTEEMLAAARIAAAERDAAARVAAGEGAGGTRIGSPDVDPLAQTQPAQSQPNLGKTQDLGKTSPDLGETQPGFENPSPNPGEVQPNLGKTQDLGKTSPDLGETQPGLKSPNSGRSQPNPGKTQDLGNTSPDMRDAPTKPVQGPRQQNPMPKSVSEAEAAHQQAWDRWWEAQQKSSNQTGEWLKENYKAGTESEGSPGDPDYTPGRAPEEDFNPDKVAELEAKMNEASAARDKALWDLHTAARNQKWAEDMAAMGHLPRTPEPSSPAPESSVCPPPCASQSSTSGEQLVSGGASVSSSFFQGVWPD